MLCLIKIMKIMITIWSIFLDMTTHTVMSIWKNMSIMKTTHIYKKIHIIMSIEIYLMLLL